MDMADIQKYFERFHETIRVDYDMSNTLREKRDIILNRIREHLKKNGRPGFDELLQGSFAMKTGIAPIEKLEFDIDVGLRFPFSENDHEASEVRKWVFEAVDGHTEKVEAKGPCVRVTYADGYHVDLVSYAVWEDALQTRHSRMAHKDNGWRKADPLALLAFVEQVMKRFDDTEDSATQTNQFRRVVRYLRRWSDEAMPKESHDKPNGLAFILLAEKHLRPALTWDGKPDDLKALQALASSLANIYGRMEAKKPTPEYDDVLAKVSDDAMKDWKARLSRLAADLSKATTEPDPVKACELVKKHLGRDFPVPTPEETGKKTSAPAIVTSSSSA
jgi:hypothetical protein